VQEVNRIVVPEAPGVKLITARVKRAQSDYESKGKW